MSKRFSGLHLICLLVEWYTLAGQDLFRTISCLWVLAVVASDDVMGQCESHVG